MQGHVSVVSRGTPLIVRGRNRHSKAYITFAADLIPWNGN